MLFLVIKVYVRSGHFAEQEFLCCDLSECDYVTSLNIVDRHDSNYADMSYMMIRSSP